MENDRVFVVFAHAVLVSCFTGRGTVSDLVSSLLSNGISTPRHAVVDMLRDYCVPLYTSVDDDLTFQSYDVRAVVTGINKTQSPEAVAC